MSVAEKLERLGRNRIYWPTDAAQRDAFANQILDALPQILAVVKAAECETAYDCINGVGHYDLTEKGGGGLGRALAALDEKL